MLTFFLRTSLAFFIGFTVLIFAIYGWRNVQNQRSIIETFFAESENCETERCFLGVVPDETQTTDIDDLFAQTDVVADYQLRAVEIQIRHLEWVWSGLQPHFVQEDGFIEFSAGVVNDLRLNTDLTLGDMLITFGEPESITTSVFDAYLYYPQQGFILQVGITCDRIWQSDVTVLYRLPSRVQLETFTLPEAIDSLCATHRSQFP